MKEGFKVTNSPHFRSKQQKEIAIFQYVEVQLYERELFENKGLKSTVSINDFGIKIKFCLKNGCSVKFL